MLKISENNGPDDIALATPTPGLRVLRSLLIKISSVDNMLLNSLRPSDANMRQQINHHCSEPMLEYCDLDP